MSRFTKRNLRNIKYIFEEKTGVELNPDHRERPKFPVRKLVFLAATIVCCLALAAFTYPLFSPLDDDELSLCGTYEGNGIVSIFVENGSDKVLEFQKQLKLMRWSTSEEVEQLGGKVVFENTKFPPHSSGTMTVDLSEAYDIEALENPQDNPEWYYLLLTNNGFLFGHDWMCSVDFFGIDKTEAEIQDHVAAAAESLDAVEEELRFYFEDAYYDEIPGLSEHNFAYLQKVDETIKRFEGDVVAPLFPMIMVTGPSTFLDPHPMIDKTPKGTLFDTTVPQEAQETFVTADWTSLDGYNRLVGATMSEKALTISALVPNVASGASDSVIPLIYTFVYEADAAQNQNGYAFLYGRFLSFEELERYKAYEDEYYVIYEVTDLFYTDLDAYIASLQEIRQDFSTDDQIMARIHNIYNYYRDKENLANSIFYGQTK